jgi:hypothetical protein
MHLAKTISSKQFRKICDGVWTDRAAVLRDRGVLAGDAALVRAVFWRLCKAGVQPDRAAENYDTKPTILAYQLVVSRMLEVNAWPAFEAAPILRELVAQYQGEAASQKAVDGRQ